MKLLLKPHHAPRWKGLKIPRVIVEGTERLHNTYPIGVEQVTLLIVTYDAHPLPVFQLGVIGDRH